MPSTVESIKRQIELWEETVAWIALNPFIVAELERMALEKARRQEKFSIYALVERVRWDWTSLPKVKAGSGPRDFKIPNNYRRYLALYFGERHPWIRHFLTTKKNIELPEALIGRMRDDVDTSTDVESEIDETFVKPYEDVKEIEDFLDTI